MKSTYHTNRTTKFVIIFELCLLSYLIFSVTSNVYESYKVDRYIEQFEEENVTLEAEIARQNEDYLYFTSPEYIDKIAKQNLGLVNPGEQVIVLSADILDPDEMVSEVDADFAIFSGDSNPAKWWNFFFG